MKGRLVGRAGRVGGTREGECAPALRNLGRKSLQRKEHTQTEIEK